MHNAYRAVNANRMARAATTSGMIDAAHRLKEARQAAGFASAAAAAERLGVPYATYSAHENGSRGFTAEAAMKYGRAFRVQPEWLLFGTPATTPDGQLQDAPALQRVAPGEPGSSSATLVSVFDVAASAGMGAMIGEETEVHSLAFPPSYLKKLTSSSPGNLTIIGVKGDSMEPTLLDDDIVLLDMSKTNLSFDGLFVLRFDDALHVKRVGRAAKPGFVTILSDNPVFPPIEVEKAELTVVGKVLWYGRKV